jgi:hypothetical protein
MNRHEQEQKGKGDSPTPHMLFSLRKGFWLPEYLVERFHRCKRLVHSCTKWAAWLQPSKWMPQRYTFIRLMAVEYALQHTEDSSQSEFLLIRSCVFHLGNDGNHAANRDWDAVIKFYS